MQGWEASVASAQQGSLEAFDALVRRFQHMAVGYAYSVLRDFHLAEDAAQEAFLQAYRDLGTLREPRAFPSWLRRLVFKHCDRITRRKRLPMVALDEAAEVPDRQGDPQKELERRETQDAVLQAVNALSEKERTTATLFYINGYSLDEVGGFLEEPVGTVKKRLYSARSHLRERMVPLVEETLKQHAPGEEFTQRVREALENVPRVSFELHRLLPGWSPETTPFSSCLRSFLEYAGETVDGGHLPLGDPGWHATYIYLMGTSGEAYRSFYPPEGFRCIDGVLRLAEDPIEPIRRGFEAAGYECEILLKARGQAEEAVYRRRILESIGRDHRPVLAFGVVGDPECCLITGFDEGGDVLIGWTFFQEGGKGEPGLEFEPSGRFRKRGWFADTAGIALAGEKRPKPPLPDLLREALLFALRIQRTPRVGDTLTGLAAMDAWAESLEHGELPGSSFAEARGFYGGTLAEARCWGSDFLEWCLEREPGLPGELRQAAECYRVIHDLVWCLWRTGDHWLAHPSEDERSQDPALRRELARLVRLMRHQDTKANEHLERALLEMGVGRERIPPVPREIAAPPRISEPERPALRFRSDLGTTFHYPEGFHPLGAPGPDSFAGWAQGRGWLQREVVRTDERRTAAVERLNTDVVLSTRAGLPVLAECDGRPAVIEGFQVWNREWLLRQTDRPDEELLRVGYADTRLGDRYTFLTRAG